MKMAPALAQARHHGRIGLGNRVAEQWRALGGRQADNFLKILHRHRHAVQRANGSALGQNLILLTRFSQQAWPVDAGDDGVDAGIDRVDPLQKGRHD